MVVVAVGGDGVVAVAVDGGVAVAVDAGVVAVHARSSCRRCCVLFQVHSRPDS